MNSYVAAKVGELESLMAELEEQIARAEARLTDAQREKAELELLPFRIGDRVLWRGERECVLAMDYGGDCIYGRTDDGGSFWICPISDVAEGVGSLSPIGGKP